MKNFYPKIAMSGIKKNKRMYFPYILTCMGMVMMYYIVAFLHTSIMLGRIQGGDIMKTMLGLGLYVIAVFALIFLFYTNSFLIRRRKKEFGLYNILGMGKWNLARILFYESVIIAVISTLGGILAGIVFSKFAELMMLNILKSDVTFSLSLDIGSVGDTIKLFAAIFFLIFLNALRQIQLSNPIELLRSENTGEKPPKANWILAFIGGIILAAAYFLAVSIQNPIEALVWFFAAVIMVIISTYLLFIAGSVTLCRILQKNKNYYYKTNHFVSVSSMVYRMKRNGAGLASICILCTMVLVMLSATTCLYLGTEDSLRSRYPRNISMDTTMSSLDLINSEETEKIKEACIQAAEEAGEEPENFLDYSVAEMTGYLTDEGTILVDTSAAYAFTISAYTDIWQIFLVSIEDYNRVMGQNETLNPDEALVYLTKSNYTFDQITIGDGKTWKVKKTVKEFVDNGVDSMQVIPSLFVFVPDFSEAAGQFTGMLDKRENPVMELHWYYGFDLNCDDETQVQIQRKIEGTVGEGILDLGEGEYLHFLCEGASEARQEFYGLYGGLFFLGILLGVVFIFAAVLIMYYKQISEGYEDQSRFEIMQKVGMTKKEIRKSINSQILTVFFLPLLVAGVHLAFAFPMIHKLLVLFKLTNLKLLILINVCCYLIFALFYVLVYRITSKAYYSIVSGNKEKE